MFRRFVLVGSVLSLLLVACSEEPERGQSGEITEEGELGIDAVQVGDCVQDDTAFGGEAASIVAVPCTDPHNAQVYHELTLTGIDEFDPEAVSDAAGDGCLEAFEGFVGMPYDRSELLFYWFSPTADSWDAGDRHVICYVWAGEGETLTESLEGAAR